ncbi:ABC transporter ATP-binding protein [Eupransor demetentiae]|uniref:ATPase and permease component (MdlB) n=1 Tax=Eupransor demetentiae TaxID=3109584 RepID=A0ABP0ER66_9LACO|nr:ABC-type multidrug transport system [Lactobacillaceae bacterium LMG 33000]
MNSTNGLFRFIKKYADINFKKFYAGIIITVISAFSALLFNSSVTPVVNSFSKGGLQYSKLILPICLLIFDLIAGVISFYLLATVAYSAVMQIRKKLWRRYNFFSYMKLSENSSGVLASRLVNDTNLISDVLSSSLPQLLTAGITIVGSFVMLLIISVKLTLALAVLLPILAFILATISNKISKYFAQTQKLTADANQIAVSILQSDIVIKSYVAEDKSTRLGDDIFSRIYGVARKQLKLIALLNPLVSVLTMTMILSVMVLGFLSVSSGGMTIGALTSYILYTFTLMAPLSNVTTAYANMAKMKDVVANLERLFETPVEDVEPGQQNLMDIESLEIVEGSFQYPGGHALYIPRLKIGEHELIRLRGKNGSGKSTILKILAGMYDLDEGHFYINGIDRRDVNIFSFREHLAFVDQNSSMLPGSIRDNLLLGFDNPATVPDEKIWEALRQVELYDFVMNLSDGLDTDIAENGGNFSGGQRQRLAIARALIADCDFYFFDEITSDLDQQTKEIIVTLMRYLHHVRNKTVVYIDHDDISIDGERSITVNAD